MKFQNESSLLSDQNSALQHSLFWRYANFSKPDTHHTYFQGQYILVWL